MAPLNDLGAGSNQNIGWGVCDAPSSVLLSAQPISPRRPLRLVPIVCKSTRRGNCGQGDICPLDGAPEEEAGGLSRVPVAPRMLSEKNPCRLARTSVAACPAACSHRLTARSNISGIDLDRMADEAELVRGKERRPRTDERIVDVIARLSYGSASAAAMHSSGFCVACPVSDR